MTDVKYPNVQVQLTGRDGNVFSVIGAVKDAIRRYVGYAEANEFTQEAMSQESYDDVLRLCLRTVDCS